MGNKQRELAEELETLESDRPKSIRKQLLETLRSWISSDFGMLMRFQPGDTLRYSFPAFVGQDEPVDAITAHAGKRAYDVPWFPPNADPGELNTFISPRSVYGDKSYFDTGAYHHVYGPLEVCDELRALLYDGTKFLGWFGIVRRGDGNRFVQKERNLLVSVFPQIKSILATADALEADLLERDLAAVLRPDGSIERASTPFGDWIDDERRDYLEGRIRAFDQGLGGSGTEYLGAAEVRLVRLDAGEGVRYVVTVERGELWSLRPEHRLTPRQKEVADFARVGAKNREIADALDISKNTVKQHLKNAYRRLGIGSRAELADVLSMDR